jgi:hypothetical protein
MNAVRYLSMLICVSVLCGPALSVTFAADRFVALDGNNSNSGTAQSPWRTLQYAADHVRPGDRVTVRAGNYVGFQLETSGTAAAPIEFFAEPGVLVNQPNPVRGQHGINLENASYVVVDGFSVTGMPRAGVRSVGSDGEEFASHVTIRNVHSYNNSYWGILTGFVNDLVIENNETSGSAIEHGIYVSNSGDRPIIRNNLSWGNDRNGIHVNGDAEQGGDGIISGALISGNIIYGNGADGGSGINMDGVQNSRIENNLLYDNHASGISLYRIDGGGGSNGNVVVNNTIHVADDGRWALNIKDGSTGNTAFNNILVSEHPTYGAIDISPDSLPGFISDYNVVTPKFSNNDTFISLTQWRSQTGQDMHSLGAEPEALFENWMAGDYELIAAALARDAGVASFAGKTSPLVDLEGKSRPIGAAFDVGAYEFGAASLAGDFNHDGTVDAADYSVWRDTHGTPEQYRLWKTHFGESDASSSPVGSASAVPEPATAFLLLTLGIGLLFHP